MDYPRTYQELRSWFPDERTCLEYLARLRWPDGFVCPRVWVERFLAHGRGLWMCTECAPRPR